MKQADREIIQTLNLIHDAQAAGGSASFASLTGSPSDNTALASALDAKQSEAEVQTIADAKVESEAYGPTWDGDTTHAPSKNDVYDKIEAVVASIPTVSSGTYTPTASNEVNLDDTPTTFLAQWMRVGNTVTVSGQFSVTTVTPSTPASFRVSLPVASNFTAQQNAGGTANSSNMAVPIQIRALASNSVVIFEWSSHASITSFTMSFTFTYQIIP